MTEMDSGVRSRGDQIAQANVIDRDHDGTGHFLVSMMDETGSIVGVAEFRADRDDLDEFLERFGGASDDVRRSLRAQVWPAPLRPVVQIAFNLGGQVAQVGQVLVGANAPRPRYFRKQGRIVGLYLDAEDGRPTFRAAPDPATLRATLSKLATWTGLDRKGNVVELPAPPPEPTRVLFANPPARLPIVAGIVEAPVLRPDGSVLRIGGYDPRTRLFYVRPPGMSPVEYQAPEDALAVIREMVREFAFDGAESRHNYLAWLLTPAVRSLIGECCVPLAHFNAPRPREGKDLLASTSMHVHVGRGPSTRPAPSSPDEWRKQITSMLLGGETLHVYTNVSGTLDSDALAGVLTSTRWTDRRLGASEDLSFVVNVTLGLTANNLVLGEDWPGRTYGIRLDSRDPNPALRRFAIPDLPGWIAEQRNELLGAVLSMCTLWDRAGRPEADITWSSYSTWARTVGGIIQHALRDRPSEFLASRGDRPPGSNRDGDDLAAVLDRVDSKVGDAWQSAAEVSAILAADWSVVPEGLRGRDGTPVLSPRRVGMYLEDRRDRFGSDGRLRLVVRRNATKNANDYRVVAGDDPVSTGGDR